MKPAPVVTLVALLLAAGCTSTPDLPANPLAKLTCEQESFVVHHDGMLFVAANECDREMRIYDGDSLILALPRRMFISSNAGPNYLHLIEHEPTIVWKDR